MKRIIFLHPLELESSDSGSRLRPRKMLDTFIKQGNEVFEIIGSRQNRIEKFEALKEAIDEGVRFDFLYVESLSRPTNSRIASFAGIKFFKEEKLDYNIIEFCKGLEIPVGFYLRDLHWDFNEHFGNEGIVKRFYMKIALRYFGSRELNFLKQNGITVFSASKSFSDYLEKNWGVDSYPLMPGGDTVSEKQRSLNSKTIRLFYVGGTVGVYDLSMFLESLARCKNAHLTLCMREKERDSLAKFFGIENLEIIHKSGKALNDFYANSDIAIYPLKPEGYVKLAFSVKLAEYIGQGLPIIIFEGSEAARLVAEKNIGWVISYHSESVVNLLNHISNSPDEYREKQQAVLDIQNQFTWDAVVNRLEEKLLNNPE